MTDEKLKQRCLELGCDEKRIDRLIKYTNMWNQILVGCDDFFGKIFGYKYDDERALQDLIATWDRFTVIRAIQKDRARDPGYYEQREKTSIKPEGLRYDIFSEIYTCHCFCLGLSDEVVNRIRNESLKSILRWEKNKIQERKRRRRRFKRRKRRRRRG